MERVELETGAARWALTWRDGAWHDDAGGLWTGEREVARVAREALGLHGPIGHDSVNVWVSTERFEAGTVTSRDYPPWHWTYVHGRRLVAQRSAATTLADDRSRASLEGVLAACLARARFLDRWVTLPESSGRSVSLAMADDELAATITAALDGVSSPTDEIDRLCRPIGGIMDEDGATWQWWVLNDGRNLRVRFPDVPELRAGELPDLSGGDDDDELVAWARISLTA